MKKKKAIMSWVILLVCIALSASLYFSMPDVGKLLNEKGQPHIPDTYSLKIAQNYIKEYNGYSKDSKISSFIILFTDKNALTDDQIAAIKADVELLTKNKTQLGITQILSHFNNAALKGQLVSPDKTTVLVSVSVDKKDRTIEDVEKDVNKVLENSKIKYSLTGAEFVTAANVSTDLDAVKKTEVFTGIIIFIILLLIFRSPVTPIASLITILLTYMASMGIVTQLVDKFNFPFSVATQSFLILVLFGIGTDYSLLLLMRFKEELTKHPKDLAVKKTYKNAGKTVLFSSVTVLIGFGVLYLANFSVFRAGAAVAIAVALLIISLFSLLRCFMYILGKKIFWPLDKKLEHKDSKIWGTLTKAATFRPFVTVVVILAVATPILFFQNSALSYDMLKEIDSSYESVKAINIISDKYGAGVVSPVTIYLKDDKALNNNNALAAIDKITENLAKVDGVNIVASVTRPQSKKIDQLYLKDQIGTVASGLNQANDGIKQLMDGLKYANKKISSSFDLSDISKLIDLNDIIYIKTGIPAIDKQLKVITEQISAQVMKTVEKNMSGSLDDITASVKQLQDGLNQAVDGLQQVSDGINQANAYLKSLPNSDNGKLFFIPADMIMKGDFRQSINNFLSKDYKLTRIIITLKIDPYSPEAMTVVNNIDNTLKESLRGSALYNATYGIDGTSSMNRDLKTISTGDYNRSIMIMLIGIGIVLMILSKSLFKAATVIGSLLIANYSALAITGFIFKDILKVGDLAWTVPFFAFIMIVALGVDYSIFFIMRFDENRKLETKTALQKSSASVGGIVMSAALILSGTFAALYPAKVPTLVELATVVIIGLFLLAFVFLPIFIPAAFLVIDKLYELLYKWQHTGRTPPEKIDAVQEVNFDSVEKL